MYSTSDSAVSPGRLLAFRILTVITGLVFVIPLFNVVAPWAFPLDTGDPHEVADRWFITVAGAADLFLSTTLLSLAWRPRQSLLAAYVVAAALIAAAINVPVDPTFLAVLAVVVPALVVYPFWADLRGVGSWWRAPHAVLLGVGVASALFVVPVSMAAIGRQIGGTDVAARGNWWADYGEHVLLPTLAVLLAATCRPGWRLLAGVASAVWLYLGLVATFVLSDATGSWGVTGGAVAILGGVAAGAVAALGERFHPALPHLRPRPA